MKTCLEGSSGRRWNFVSAAAIVFVLACSSAGAQVPGEVTGLSWCAGSTTCVQWTATPTASSYQLVRGDQAGLPALLGAGVDSCNRLVVTSPTASGLGEVPPPGGLFWYLVTAGRVCGQGPAGDATAGARTVNSSGNCDATCADTLKNGLETDTDCGGSTCAPCANTKQCLVPSDWASKVCLAGTCQAPTCVDGVQNGLETGVDCGGSGCSKCGNALGCCAASDCQSGSCNAGTCGQDGTPPTVAIISPGDGTTASGMVTVVANATDNVGVTSVQFQLDGANLGAADTTAPFAVPWNTTSSSAGPHTLTAIAYDGTGNQATSNAVGVTVSNSDPASLSGSWDPAMDWPIVTVHASLLYNGKLLLWDGYDGPVTLARLWDPQSNTFTTVTAPGPLFCGGHAGMSDGRLIVMGGDNQGPASEAGTPETNIFDPATNTWTRVHDMHVDRWYPSIIQRPDGRIIALSGQIQSNTFADTPEIYDPTTNLWTNLALSTSDTHDHEYALSYGLPDGRVFVLAASTLVVRMFNPSVPSWTPLPSDPKLSFTSAVSYRPWKVMASGGGVNGSAAQTSALVIDTSAATPAWRSVSSMAFPRYQHNLLMLADGTVFAVGGMTAVDQSSHSASLAGEIWNPLTETWYTVASMRDARGYHSTAVLLPDARVLSAGGGREGSGTDYLTGQIFSPPYLFKGPRPTIQSAPSIVNYGSDITVFTPDAQNISMVSLVNLTSVTHTLDMNQRFQELAFTKNANSLTVTMPASASMAPPAYYMLFIVNDRGVPSVASMVRFPLPSEDAEPPTAPVLSASPSGNNVNLSWTASTDNVGIAQYNVHRSLSAGFTPTGSTLIGSTATLGYVDQGVSGTLYYKVVAQDPAGNPSPPSNEQSVALPTDSSSPTVSITAPSDGAAVSGTIPMSANASDNVGVTGVQFLLDGANLGSEDLTSPYSISWDTTTASNASHTLTARARDFAGNVTTSAAVTVTVNNAPTFTINFNDVALVGAPLNGQYPTGVANWGTNVWYTSPPWRLFTTNSVSFNGPGQTSGTFTFVTPKRLLSVKAFNGGTVSSTITLSCTGNGTKSVPVAVNTVVTINTNWLATCSAVTVGSSNGWNTNFDDFVYDGGP